MGMNVSTGIIFGYEVPEDYRKAQGKDHYYGYDGWKNPLISFEYAGSFQWDMYDMPLLAGVSVSNGFDAVHELPLEARWKIAGGLPEEEHAALKELAKELDLEGESPKYYVYGVYG